MRSIDYIVLSCTNTPDWEQIDVEDLHRAARIDGKTGIGEHFIIQRNGVWEIGRSIEVPANVLHAINKNSIVIKFIGSTGNFTELQKEALDDLIEIISYDLGYFPLIRELSAFDMWETPTGLA